MILVHAGLCKGDATTTWTHERPHCVDASLLHAKGTPIGLSSFVPPAMEKLSSTADGGFVSSTVMGSERRHLQGLHDPQYQRWHFWAGVLDVAKAQEGPTIRNCRIENAGIG